METTNHLPTPNQTSEMLESQSPLVSSETAKKSSPGLLLVLALVFLLVLVGGVYFKISRSRSPELMKKNDTVVVKPSVTPKPSDEVPVSSSDEVDAIEQDLDNTTVSDDDELYTELNTDLRGL